MDGRNYIRPFAALTLGDVPLVGGKTASLGELASLLEAAKVRVPVGFAITAEAYRDALGAAEAWSRLQRILDFDLADVGALAQRAAQARKIVYDATGGPDLRENGLEVYVMCEIPNNVIQIDAFAKLFDGFSIGSNDLTQLVLGVDRDSETVAFDFGERDPGVLELLRQAVVGSHRNGGPVGICGEAPATYPKIAAFLTDLGIDSMSVNPQSLPRTLAAVRAAEAKQTASIATVEPRVQSAEA